MKRLWAIVVAVLAVGVIAVPLSGPGGAPAGASALADETLLPAAGALRVVSTPEGSPTGGDGPSVDPDLTPDGRYLVFASTATDLVSSPASGGRSQVYLRDLSTGAIRMISTTADGTAAGNGDSGHPSISDSGSAIAYVSTSTNVASPTNTVAQALVWIRATGETAVASLTDDPTPAPGAGAVTGVAISGNGLVLAFSELGGFADKEQVYARDLVASETSEVSSVAYYGASEPSVSFDGTRVAFRAGGIVSGRLSQIFLWERGWSRAQVISWTGSSSGDGDSWFPSISSDGTSVAFSSRSLNFTDDDLDGRAQVYSVGDDGAAPTLTSTVPHRGTPLDGVNSEVEFSADGRKVAFVTTAPDATPRTSDFPQLVLKDLNDGSITQVVAGVDGRPADGPVHSPVLTGDGRWVAFASTAKNLATGSPAGVSQVFLADMVQQARVERVGGADRFAVSAEVSARSFPTGVPVVYLASGQSFPDALSGSAIAGARSGPILLVRKDGIPDAIAAELVRLRPQRIIVLGGAAAIDASVETAAKIYSGSVTRVDGIDRFAVSAAASAGAPAIVVRPAVEHPTVFVSSGETFPDALSGSALAGNAAAGGSWAGSLPGPVLLVSKDAVPAPVKAEIARLKPKGIVVLGGTESVSTAVQNQLAAIAPVTRTAGADRFVVSAAVARSFTETGKTVVVASGENYPDALSGGAAAIQSGSPVLLVRRDAIPESISVELRRLAPTRIVVLGGTAAVTDAVSSQLATYLAH